MLSRQKRVRRSALRVRSILLAAVVGVGTILPLESHQAWATTDSWKPTTGGNWGTASNWFSNAIPTANQDVWITNSFVGTQTITLNITPGVVFHSLTLDATGGGTNVFQTGNNDLSFGPVGETIGNSGNANFQQQGGADTLTNAVLIIANNVGSTGTYAMSGSATLTANSSNEFVGFNSAGTFVQGGGTNTLGTVLDLGTNSNGTGTYLLTAGNLVANNSSEFIGDGGIGSFQLLGGTHTITGGTLTMGAGSGSTGTYLLIAGLLTCTNAQEIVGNQGLGNFQQLGGVNSLNGGALVLGSNSFSTGPNTYSLNAGSMLVASNAFEIIGGAGVGIFNQNPASSNTISSGVLYLGYNAGATGTYTLTAGATLLASGSDEIVGNSGTGIFNQAGGTNTAVGSFYIAFNAHSSGTYTLQSGASLTAINVEYIGNSGNGNFNQTGGTNSMGTNLVLAFNAGATGTYTLSGGLLTPGNPELIGFAGSGNFNQTGGTNQLTAATQLNLGDSAAGTGTYTLSGGLLSATNSTEVIGNIGIGIFNHTGGTNNFNGTGSLIVGNNAGSTGTYNLGTGVFLTATSTNETIGLSGTGNFNQTGGTNTLNSASLTIASNTTSVGTYILGGGSLFATNSFEYVGFAGNGNFNQTGGTNTIAANSLYIAINPGSTGTYNLSGGTLIAGNFEYVGFAAKGNFNQSGGTNTFSRAKLVIGNSAAATGAYTLSGTGLLKANDTFEYVGFSGTGNFNQTGGTNSLTFDGNTSSVALNIGNNSGSHGTYNLSGGTLSANNVTEQIGLLGAGIFNQTGGTNTMTGNGLYLALPAAATYSLGSNAAVVASNCSEFIGYSGTGNFNQTGGANTVTGGGQQVILGYLPGSTGNYTLSGGTLSTPGLYVGGSSGGAGGRGTFNVSGSGTFTIAGAMQIFGNATASITNSIPNAALDSVNSLQIFPGGLLTLDNSALTINYGTTPNPNATIRSYISSAYNLGGSLWTGATGITSTNAAADPAHHSVAFADGADGVVIHLPAGISPNAPGGTLAAGSELATYAYAADANLDAKVDFADFIILSNHFGTPDINWDHGNFNYDPNIDFADFIILSNNFGDGVMGGNGIGATPAELAQYNALAQTFGISQSQIAAWDAKISDLPEPASWGLLAMGAGGLLRRRKRRLNEGTDPNQ